MRMVDYIYDFVRLSSLPSTVGRPRSADEERKLHGLRTLLESRPGAPGIRRWNRMTVTWEGRLVRPDAEHRVIVIEASAGGFLVRTATPLTKEDRWELRIETHGRPPVVFPCRVAWASLRGRSGLAIAEQPYLPVAGHATPARA